MKKCPICDKDATVEQEMFCSWPTCPLPLPPSSFFGIPVAASESVPPDTIEFRYGNRVVGKIVNLPKDEPK